MRTHSPSLALTLALTLATIALAGFCNHVAAQEPCPELTRLRGEAAEALKKATSAPTQDRCDAYIRVSLAWSEIARYAKGHRESCDISSDSLSEIDQRHREAVEERTTICGGRRPPSILPEVRPRRSFPPEIWSH